MVDITYIHDNTSQNLHGRYQIHTNMKTHHKTYMVDIKYIPT